MKKILIVAPDGVKEYVVENYALSINQYENYDLILDISQERAAQTPQNESEHLVDSMEPAPMPQVTAKDLMKHSSAPQVIAEGVGKPSKDGYKTDEPFPQSFPVNEAKEIFELLTKSRADNYIQIKPAATEIAASLKPIVIQTEEFGVSKIKEAVDALVALEKAQSSCKTILIVHDPVCEFNSVQATFHIKESVMFEDFPKIENNE